MDSACLKLIRRPAPFLPGAQARQFSRIVKRGFSQRRKMMFKLLKGDWALPALEAAFLHVGLSRQVRAEAVSLEQFIQLTRILSS